MLLLIYFMLFSLFQITWYPGCLLFLSNISLVISTARRWMQSINPWVEHCLMLQSFSLQIPILRCFTLLVNTFVWYHMLCLMLQSFFCLILHIFFHFCLLCVFILSMCHMCLCVCIIVIMKSWSHIFAWGNPTGVLLCVCPKVFVSSKSIVSTRQSTSKLL